MRPLQISGDFETPLFEVSAYLLDFCVPDERDLSTSSNFNPRNTPYIPVVKILAFPRSKSGIFDLNSNKNYHFSKVSVLQYGCTIDALYIRPIQGLQNLGDK